MLKHPGRGHEHQTPDTVPAPVCDSYHSDSAGVIRKRDTVDRSKSGGTVGEGGAGGEGGPDEEAKITLTSQMMLDGCPYATGDM